MPTNWGAIIPLIDIIVKVVDQVIIWIEKMWKGKTGTEKKEAATKAVNALLPHAKEGIVEMKDIISETIDARVAAFNLAGKFKHTKKLKS